MPKVKLLYVDAYDSFSNNIIALLEQLQCQVSVVRIDDPLPDLDYDAVVIGPGPGHPAKPKDVGFIPKLWASLKAQPLPTLGICLGFQSLGVTFGAHVKHLRQPRHGIVDKVNHRGRHFFRNAGQITATSYHSLTVVNLPDDLVPLAYMQDEVNGRILAAMKHRTLPFWGVQYHPESVCSDKANVRVLKRWLSKCNRSAWNDDLAPPTLYRNPPGKSSETVSLSFNIQSILPVSSAPKWTVHSGTPDLSSLVGQDNILLESQKQQQYSILSFSSVLAEYTDCLRIGNHVITCTVQEAWQLLGSIATYKGEGPATPFWGGWMGYASYEAGLQSIGIKADAAMKFSWVERSIVIDHEEGVTYLQSIRPDDDWIHTFKLPKENSSLPKPVYGTVELPDETSYREKVLSCQQRLNAGDSYELCLTCQTVVTSHDSPIDIYRSLRKANPAPYGAYLRLGNTVLLSSSPERFLKWNRNGECSLKPIKGTVRKSEMSREAAYEVLSSTKERAENLMIVDLIRHDLHSVCSDVSVPSLMQVEEYETVYQLVSTISGTGSGVDVLGVALPPGSMTGAPKLRSCEILQDLEETPRGVYAGVCGYIDIGGGGDFSVVIRSMFTEDYKPGVNEWQIGAGGAITTLSDDKAEYNEMRTKLDSSLRAFILEDRESSSTPQG